MLFLVVRSRRKGPGATGSSIEKPSITGPKLIQDNPFDGQDMSYISDGAELGTAGAPLNRYGGGAGQPGTSGWVSEVPGSSGYGRVAKDGAIVRSNEYAYAEPYTNMRPDGNDMVAVNGSQSAELGWSRPPAAEDARRPAAKDVPPPGYF
ncbi:uncharacterized protein B0I36DRAFT_338721 [Microdochium trichocladiopsis]|uniref:Uncharacterized protein n=1 Tax=Microdochium trichocladiopsis TaxID=1682393 RepID=A0A9P9BG87_9PEZI|nr:uncharacterized protein B0I36DRAFT_338721 [Microdochium trichocladiopsis]KAH7014429.1 hypothetical protein B0I36DRAFT_338721 [Microdochium trichocladiopsis]